VQRPKTERAENERLVVFAWIINEDECGKAGEGVKLSHFRRIYGSEKITQVSICKICGYRQPRLKPIANEYDYNKN
jgi:hypothetical protein